VLGAPAAASAATPDVTITKPLGGQVINTATPTVKGIGEPGAGAVTVVIYNGPSDEGPVEESRPARYFEPGDMWVWGSDTMLPEGVYTARASQTNADGETGLSAPVTFTIRLVPPTLSLSQPESPTSNVDPSFTGTTSAPGPIVVQVYAGPAQVSEARAVATGSAWTSAPATRPLPVGQYTAVAYEESGELLGESAAQTFTVTSPPAGPVPAAPPPAAAVLATTSRLAPASPLSLLMAPFPVVRVAGQLFANGVELRLLKVQLAPAGALVSVRCRGRGCPRRSVVRRTTTEGPHGVAAITFPSFERYLHVGAVIEVLVWKAGEIGKYTRLRVRRGKLPERLDECLALSGLTPLTCPAV